MFDLITCPHCEYVAHIGSLVGPTTDDCPRCGKRALYSVAHLLREAEQLREALYMALPFVEDHEGSPVYKPQAVAQAAARIRKALGEPKP